MTNLPPQSKKQAFFLMGQAQFKEKIKRKFDPREEFFIRNGGILLEKQIALSQSQDIGAQQLKIFSAREIEKATNNYDLTLIVGSFREECIYRGKLDGRTVAIKTPQEIKPNPELIDLVLTEASTGMVLCHNNMVKLYGCCLETYIPMIVYEFLPNNDVYSCLHCTTGLRNPLKWTARLRVAADIAHALSYMHNALSKAVVHRDVMSIGILLDSSLHAKLGNFGHSVSITPDETEQNLPVHGTPGYMDPEYIENKEVTDKCDVYSFGVLMLELLTGSDPIEMAQHGTDLVHSFVSAVEKNCIKEIIDRKVLEQGNIDEIEGFARLALACVANKGEERPTMIDVVNELWLIRDQDSK